VPLWQLLLGGQFPLLDQWCQFVQEHYKKAISRDTWNLLLDFSRNVKSDMSNYDADGAVARRPRCAPARTAAVTRTHAKGHGGAHRCRRLAGAD